MTLDKQSEIKHPIARSEGVLIENVGAETVVFDEETKIAHALKPLASAVFMYADGTNSVADIAELASYRLDVTVSESEVAEAVLQLDESGLLDTPSGILSTGISRRTALKTFAAAGAGTMLVSSVVAPFASATTLTQLQKNGIPYTCCYVGRNQGPLLKDSGHSYDSDPKVSTSKAPSGWPQPYVQSSSGYSMATNGSSSYVPGAPETAGDYNLGHSCIAAVNSGKPVYGTYQVVPCDGSTWACADVVCVPTSNGNSINNTKTPGVQLKIAGAIISGPIYTGSGSSFPEPSGVTGPAYGSYNNYAYWEFPFKICCGNGQSGCTPS